MRGFSDDEYRQIIEDLFYREPADAELLLAVVDRLYKNRIKSWCYSQPVLAGRGYEEDILQELKIKVLTQSIPFFFLKKGVEFGINDSPEEFAKWLQEVAKNLQTDYLRRQLAVTARTRCMAEWEDFPQNEGPDLAETEEQHIILAKAFKVVLNSDSSAHIVLSWIASFLFIYEYGVKSCHVSKEIVQTFEEKTLNEMRDYLIRSAGRIPWLSLSAKQTCKLDASLKQKYDEKHTFGQMKYSTFFMKSGGKSSISNWNNRMNNLVRRVIKQ